jgi:hypothetical protein
MMTVSEEDEKEDKTACTVMVMRNAWWFSEDKQDTSLRY